MSTHVTVVRRIILAIAVRSPRLIGATAAIAVVPPIAFPTATRRRRSDRDATDRPLKDQIGGSPSRPGGLRSGSGAEA
jgi:hypothetical protein